MAAAVAAASTRVSIAISHIATGSDRASKKKRAVYRVGCVHVIAAQTWACTPQFHRLS